MMWAVLVPAFMIHTPPCSGVSGRPVVSVVAPGTAIVTCVLAWAWSGPLIVRHTDPYSG